MTNQCLMCPLTTPNILLRTVVKADARRAFTAFVEEEYREAWLYLPNQEGISMVQGKSAGSCFNLNYYRHNELAASVKGQYQILKRRKMLFTWEKWDRRQTHTSRVRVSLQGAFSDTIVELHHSGLPTEREYMWHLNMWRSALIRFGALFA